MTQESVDGVPAMLATPWVAVRAWVVGWLLFVTGCFPLAVTHAQVEETSIGRVSSEQDLMDESSDIKIRKLFVPEDHLIEFMRGRPTYLPLSSAKFQEMLSGLQPVPTTALKAEPLRHWIVASPGGSVQGYSLVRGRPYSDGLGPDSPAGAWLSFDDWKIPADYFNLVPNPSPSFDTADVSTLGRATLSGNFTEVPVAMSVNEQGLFGLPLVQAEAYMLVRYNLSLATQAEANLYRQLRLPNSPSTLTFVRNPANAVQPFQVHGTMLRVSRPLSLFEFEDNQSFEFFQAISDAPQLIGQFNNTDRMAEPASVRGRYVEHSTVAIRPSVIQYETLITLEFRESVRSDMTLEVPPGLELVSCEVNGQPQVLQLSAESQGVRRLKLPWQSWGVSNRVRVTGTMTPSTNGRVAVPRTVLPGHTWIMGNLQVSVEPPLLLRDYELINARVVNCQELGQAQNLSFHWGAPESHVTLLVDTASSRSAPLRPSSLDVVLLTAEQENLEADQYFLLDNRFRDSNVLALKVADSWQVEQVAVVDLRQLPETSADRIPEASTTPLQWTPSLEGDQPTILVAMPTDPKEGLMAVRVRAVRPVNQWPIDIDCQIVPGLTESSQPSRPCLVSLRGTAGIQARGADPTDWEILTNEEARRMAAELRGVVGAGSFRFSDEPSRLTLQNNAELTGSYDVLAYTKNQLDETGIIRQWHRLLIQPSGPVYDVDVASSRPTQLAGRWSVQDDQGRPIPFEVSPVGDGVTFRVRFPKPLSDSVSIVIEQEWVPESDGVMLLYFAPNARSFAGVMDSSVPASRVFSIETPPNRLDERLRQLSDFRSASRRWYNEKRSVPVSPDATVGPRAGQAIQGSDRASAAPSNFESVSLYEHPREVRFNQGPVRVVWSSAMVTSAMQIDTWQQDAWATRLLIQVFSETADTITIELPVGTPLASVQVDRKVVVPNQEANRIEIPLSGTGAQSIQIRWREPHDSRVALGSGLIALPARNELLQATKFSQRLVCVPQDFSLTAVPNESTLVQLSVGRRLISPLVWTLGWSTLAQADTMDVPGWSRVLAPAGNPPEPYRWWRQEVPLAATPITSDRVWVMDQRLFVASQWVILLVGCVVAIGIDRWRRSRAGALWWLGGGCLAFAMLASWPYYMFASTALLGLLIGCSWSDLWRILNRPVQRESELAMDRSSSKFSQSIRGLRSVPSSLWFWGVWLGLNAQLGMSPDSLAAVVSSVETRFDSAAVSSVKPNRLQDETQKLNPDTYYSVVVPVDGEQKPSDKVVYLSPELYRRLSNLAAASGSVRDLEIRNAQHTLEYDSQLQRFSRLTTQYTCKTQAEKLHLLPVNAQVDHVVRQVRVNGVPVLFQKRGELIEVALDAGTSLLSVSYDLQSIGSALELSALGANDSYVVLNGVPNGWQAMVADRDYPMVRFRSSIQRRFRVDRIKQLMIEVQPEATDWPMASVETWLDIQPQSVQCELRLTAGRWAKTQPEWLFQVDSRMTLPPSFQANAPTWTLERLPDEQRPLSAKAGPVYRLRFSEDHDPNHMLRIPWEYSGRSFGGVVPPQVAFLDLEHLRIRKWLVVRVGNGLVYRPFDLSMTNYRRGSPFELSGLRANGDSRNLTAPTTNSEFGRDGGVNSLPAVTDTFVYEELPSLAEASPAVVGQVSLQPTQVIGSLRQDIQLNERSAAMNVSGEIEVTHGELSQFPIRMPKGARIQRLSIATAAQNEVAWTVPQPTATYEQVIVLLRTPVVGRFRFDLDVEVKLPSTETSLPWVRLMAPIDVGQTVQLRDLTGGWSWRSLGGSETPNIDHSIVEPQDFVVSSDTVEAMDQIELTRQQVPRRVVGTESVLDLSPKENAESSSTDVSGIPDVAQRGQAAGPRVALLGSRLVVTKLDSTQNPGSGAVIHRRLEAVQQFLLRNQRASRVSLSVPVGVKVQRAWVDQRPADVWLPTHSAEISTAGLPANATLEKQPNSGSPLSQEKWSSPEVPSSRDEAIVQQVEVALDPLDEFSLITLQLSWEAAVGSADLELIKVSADKSLPVLVDVMDGLEWPEELVVEPCSSFGGEVNIQEVFAKKTGVWTPEAGAAPLPLDHPLLGVAQQPWPESGSRTKLAGYLTLAATTQHDSAGSSTWVRWDWVLVLVGMAVVWLLGVIWPNRLPKSSVWGDFGWLLVASGVWLGGGPIWLILLLSSLAISFLLLRVLRSGFSFRFA